MNLKDIELTDEQRSELIKMRGGCRCHISPPCNACVDPIDEAEAESLGLLPEEPAPAGVDYLKAVRDFCR